MTPAEIARLRGLCERATPLDDRHAWSLLDTCDTDGNGCEVVESDDGGGCIIATFGCEEDARFCIAARTALPALLDDVERLMEGLAEAGARMTVEGEQEWCIGANRAPRYSLNTILRNLLAGRRWDSEGKEGKQE